MATAKQAAVKEPKQGEVLGAPKAEECKENMALEKAALENLAQPGNFK